MAQISAATSISYGRNTPFFVPPRFLYNQRKRITPHVCQIVALSETTGYRFTDWMKMCGFDLNLIFALQVMLHEKRTTLVTPNDVMAGLSTSSWNSEWLSSRKHYVFAKVGTSDGVVHPLIHRGSVVRVNRAYSQDPFRKSPATDALWLVEYAGGLVCCQVQRLDQSHIVLLPNRAPLPSWPLLLEKEARVLGVVDLEICPLHVPPETTYHSPRFEHHPFLASLDGALRFSRLLRVSRSRAGLTLREAREMTMAVARLLGNRAYGIALGQLSDYEAAVKLPRHVEKIMSLCIVYGIHPWDLLASAGVRVDDSGRVPLGSDEAASDLLGNLYIIGPPSDESGPRVEADARTAGQMTSAVA